MRSISALLALACLAACGGGGGGDDDEVDFQAFVIQEITQDTLETNDPEQINGLEFQFEEDQAAFAALFPQ